MRVYVMIDKLYHVGDATEVWVEPDNPKNRLNIAAVNAHTVSEHAGGRIVSMTKPTDLRLNALYAASPMVKLTEAPATERASMLRTLWDGCATALRKFRFSCVTR